MSNGGIHDIPASVTSQWPQPDQHPNDVRDGFTPFAVTLQGITTALLICRLWSRFKRYSGHLGFDDLLIFLGWLFATALTIVLCLGVINYGFDRHMWDVPRDDWESVGFIIWLSSQLFFAGCMFVKCSILFFHGRIIGGTYDRIWVWATWVAITFTVLYSLALILTLFLICLPFGTYWESIDPKFDGNATCINEVPFWMVAGVLAVVSDFYSLIIPGILLWRLKMTRSQRAGLTIIFLLALGAIGAGIGRAYYLKVFADLSHGDLTYNQFPIFITSQFEVQATIMCACAPSLKGFFTEGVGQPIASAYRRGSKHISSSLASIYSNGSRFHHPVDSKPSRKPSHPVHHQDAPVRMHSRRKSSVNHHNYADKPNFSMPKYTHKRNDSANSDTSPPSAIPPTSRYNHVRTPTPPNSIFASPRAVQPFVSPKTHVVAHMRTPSTPRAATNPFSPPMATPPSAASLTPATNPKRASNLGASPSQPYIATSPETPRTPKVLRKPSRGDLPGASPALTSSTTPTTGLAPAVELQERARNLHLEKLREEREREAEEESRAAEVFAARRGEEVVPDTPGWNAGLGSDEAWARYQRGVFGPVPPPKDWRGRRGSGSAVGSESSKESSKDSGSMV